MDSSSPSAGFVSFDDTVLCAWYTQYGHMRIRTSLIVAEVKELQRLSNEHAPNRRMPTHPLHLMALIQQDHPLIYNPLWTRTFFPLLCPSSLAPNYLGRHLCYFQNLQRNNPNHAQLRPDNDLFSKKLAFCLGYSLQAFWINGQTPVSCLYRHDHHAGVWQAYECVQSHIRSITSSTTPAPSSSSSSATAPAPAAPKLCQCVPMTSSMYSAWRASKSYGRGITHMGIFANDDEQKNWKDLEGALATLWRVFQLEFRDLGAGLWYHGAFDEMRKWGYISPSEQEEQWLSIYSSRDDGPHTMSALGMGLKEAGRVQRHWEKTKKWLVPMYPAEWEGWEVPVDEVKEDEWVML
ncbi:hypothetical protein SMACR_07267 [Sordaria macrospora]|uniref:WGS project CABT00000000 data, contig 2.44 n=2 Tax=Sordaria macrospora TaxID=5147 RepID=F7W8B3_SORMK|nr:uncharacterized protein SMAC_07267 [Sordaria macrospora k-hell]KAA8631839.1 hypothetical protein SMACR_07267 [Sordaria macrospora]WPJ62699.1 hypothetical protein SMAC4_07267 [Sordaria macrospora]CCC13758.1 unnamed protein product [Sordaria macrospora k-hell]